MQMEHYIKDTQKKVTFHFFWKIRSKKFGGTQKKGNLATPENVKFQFFGGNLMKKKLGVLKKKSIFVRNFLGVLQKKGDISIFWGISFWGYSKKNGKF